jgi:hypothetical protein
MNVNGFHVWRYSELSVRLAYTQNPAVQCELSRLSRPRQQCVLRGSEVYKSKPRADTRCGVARDRHGYYTTELPHDAVDRRLVSLEGHVTYEYTIPRVVRERRGAGGSVRLTAVSSAMFAGARVITGRITQAAVIEANPRVRHHRRADVLAAAVAGTQIPTVRDSVQLGTGTRDNLDAWKQRAFYSSYDIALSVSVSLARSAIAQSRGGYSCKMSSIRAAICAPAPPLRRMRSRCARTRNRSVRCSTWTRDRPASRRSRRAFASCARSRVRSRSGGAGAPA